MKQIEIQVIIIIMISTNTMEEQLIQVCSIMNKFLPIEILSFSSNLIQILMKVY